jgi:hypothetical protein
MIAGEPWWATLVYLIVGLQVGRIAGGWAMHYEREGKSLRGEDRFMGFVVLVVGALFWPVWVTAWLWRKHGEAFVVTPPNIRVEQERERKAQLRRTIYDQARQLGMPPPDDDDLDL